MKSKVDAPCPHCHSDASLSLLAMSSEIPYFGEHTQITVICGSCGWKHTDFIPSDGTKPGFSMLVLDSEEKCSARVVRSSSCTIRIPELDLEVAPGGSSSGFVTNIEGVIERFEGAVGSVIRSNDEDGGVIESANLILEALRKARFGDNPISIQLLDPRGRSQIIHHEAETRELSEDENSVLEIGPEIPVFEVG